jgi:hypothetical protein
VGVKWKSGREEEEMGSEGTKSKWDVNVGSRVGNIEEVS